MGSKGRFAKPAAARQAPKPRASKVKGGITRGVFAAVQAAATAVASGKPGDTALAHAIRDQNLPPREGRRAHSFADQIFRHWARLGWIWAQAKGEAGARERVLLALRLFLETPTSEIAALLRGDVAAERLGPNDANVLDRVPAGSLDDKAMPRLVRLECPQAMAEPLQRALGDQFERELLALAAPPDVVLRVNTLKASRDAIMAELAAAGAPAAACPLAPHGVRTVRGAEIANLAAFERGAIEIQDEGSQLVAHLVGARPGMQVLDLCAGAGGKTLAIAADMQNKGHLVAADTHSGRLTRSKQRLKRAGVENAECVLLDAKWLKAKQGRFDRVLVDAPCTGTGAWARNPDQRWALDDGALSRLIAEQDALLDTAIRMVKPGGLVIYATCSLLLEENEDRIRACRDRYPHMTIAPARRIWCDLGLPQWPSGGHEYFRVSPARHNTDGFFAAILQSPPLARRHD
jgi:16S rRNA (cytosine967-C5)-methyltransferase